MGLVLSDRTFEVVTESHNIFLPIPASNIVITDYKLTKNFFLGSIMQFTRNFTFHASFLSDSNQSNTKRTSSSFLRSGLCRGQFRSLSVVSPTPRAVVSFTPRGNFTDPRGVVLLVRCSRKKVLYFIFGIAEGKK